LQLLAGPFGAAGEAPLAASRQLEEEVGDGQDPGRLGDLVAAQPKAAAAVEALVVLF
jgi:hypothetical protein